MKKGDQNGTLVLGIKRGEEINIEYSKSEIIRKINSYFGYKLINEIKLQTFSLKNNKIKKNNLNKFSKNYEKKIGEIKNNDIKNSLLELFNTIKND